MNRSTVAGRSRMIRTDSGRVISVEVDTGLVWVNPGLLQGARNIPKDTELSGDRDRLLEACRVKNDKRGRLFLVAAPVSLLLFVASVSAHLLLADGMFSLFAFFLSISFIVATIAAVYFYITSGGMGELVTASYRAEGRPVVPDTSEQTAYYPGGYPEYIASATGYAMPLLSPRLYSILTSGAPQRSDMRRRPIDVTERGISGS